MQVQVNVKSAAKRISQFIAAAGGATKHGEILELVAEVCGFDSYRALLAASSKEVQAVAPVVHAKAPASANPEVRLLESPERVVFSTTAVDWQLAGNPQRGLDEVPQQNRTPYDFIVEQDGGQFRVLMKPVGVHLDNFEGRNVLDMLIEINEGLPCVHMTNDPADQMLVTVFATGEGLLVREDGGEWMRGEDHRAPAGLVTLAIDHGRGSDLSEAHLAVLVTAEKYQSHEKPSESQGPKVVQSQAARVFPYARTSVVQPVRRRHVDSYVTVDFALGETEPGLLNAWVKLFDAEGVCGDEDAVLLLIRRTTGASDAQLKKLADNVAQLTAFFVEGGFDMGDLRDILQGIASDDDASGQAEKMVKEALDSDTRDSAYELITALVVG
jgi:hypothetical protein